MLVLDYARTITRHFFLQFSPILKFQIYEESMMPTLNPGDLVLVERLSHLFRSPKINDLVVFRINQKKVYIKRISAINEHSSSSNKDKFFMTGDNISKSKTSKHFGWVDKKDIIGKVFFIL